MASIIVTSNVSCIMGCISASEVEDHISIADGLITCNIISEANIVSIPLFDEHGSCPISNEGEVTFRGAITITIGENVGHSCSHSYNVASGKR